MQIALDEAREAFQEGEVPVGAVVVAHLPMPGKRLTMSAARADYDPPSPCGLRRTSLRPGTFRHAVPSTAYSLRFDKAHDKVHDKDWE